jgi:tetratricopeptide (TPR) repeat protein
MKSGIGLLGRGPMVVACLCITVVLWPMNRRTGQQPEQAAKHESKSAESRVGLLELETSDAALAAAFGWARRQALAYAFRGDPVGDWYEAALPGRQAFCMRDVSHQSMGAHALGLGRYTRNMLGKFAENISESKDWCSYWEINRENRPASVDYHDDADFWYNLPANFDVLDASLRMYLWSGDRAYLSEGAFLNFYRRTAHNYVERWDLGLDRIMTRQRIMNIRGPSNPANRFQTNRGIPSYEESDTNFVVAVDQVAVEYAGYLAYARFSQLLGNEEESREFLKRASDTKTFLNDLWWDKDSGSYYSSVGLDHKMRKRGLNLAVLYYGAAEEGAKADLVVNAILRSIANKEAIGIEEQSHLPEILYRYGKADAAYDQILDLTGDGKNRREYPEVSYAVVGAIVTGMMGIEVMLAEPQKALEESLYVEGTVGTLSRLTAKTKWAEVKHVPVRANEISVRHDGFSKTTLTNEAGPALMWDACFGGSHRRLLANGKAVEARATGLTRNGQTVSCATVVVGSGERKIVGTME